MVQPGTCICFLTLCASVQICLQVMLTFSDICLKAAFKQWAFWAIWAFVIMAQEIFLPFSDTNPHLSPTVFASIEKDAWCRQGPVMWLIRECILICENYLINLWGSPAWVCDFSHIDSQFHFFTHYYSFFKLYQYIAVCIMKYFVIVA